MTSTDITRRTQGIALAVGLFAGGDSYTHIYSLAREHHQDVISAALLPLAGDGVVIAASSVMLMAAKAGQRQSVPFKLRAWFWGGIIATLAANGAYGYQHGFTNALLSLWAVAAYLGCTELLVWVHLHLGAQPKMQPKKPRPASKPEAAPEVRDALADELKVRRERRNHRPLHEILAAAEERFPEIKTGGRIPPLRELQTVLGIGQLNAQAVQRHFRGFRAVSGLCCAS